MDNYYFFSYGMCANPRIMARHDYAKPVGVATLHGYKLAFNYHATVVPGDEMLGVLWEINLETLARLDFQEDCPVYYTRKVLQVTCDGKKYDAFVYIMTENISLATVGVEPTETYVRLIREAYQEFSIPEEQITKALRETLEKNYEVN
jgi:gamma-glutamylcyclotransferase (GGCT)/AIG2-like uncharacterized protein YtfP